MLTPRRKDAKFEKSKAVVLRAFASLCNDAFRSTNESYTSFIIFRKKLFHADYRNSGRLGLG